MTIVKQEHSPSRFSVASLKRAFSTLQARLLLLIVFVLIPVTLLVIFTASEQGQLASVTAENEALRFAQLAASNQEQLVAAAEQLLNVLSRLPVVRNGDADACNAFFKELHERYTNYTNFFAVDTNGDTYCTGIVVTPPVNVGNRDWFQRAMKANGFSVSNYQLGAVSKRPVLTFSYPVYDDAGKIKYQVAVSLDLNWMSQFIKNTDLPSDTTVTAVDRQGIILYRYPNGEDWLGKQYPNPVVIDQVTTKGTGLLESKGINNTDRLFGFAPLPKTNGGTFVIVSREKSAAFAEANRLLIRNLIGLLVVGILTVLIAWYGLHNIVLRPMRVLMSGTTQLAAGELGARVNERQGTVELSELAYSFNHMAGALQERQQELASEIAERQRVEAALRAARDDLENRVLERTSELSNTNQRLEAEIGERLKTEKLLQEQSEWFRVTLSSIGDAVIVTDTDERITFMNPVAESLTGWTQGESLGKSIETVFNLVDENTRQPVESVVSRVMKQGTIVGLVNHALLLAKDGRKIPIDDSGAPIRDSSGQITGVILVFRDITERKRTEANRQFLVEAAVALNASLDYEHTLTTITQLAVPRLADWCAIFAKEEGVDGQPSVRLVTVAHADTDKAQQGMENGQRFPPSINDNAGAGHVIRTGKSEFFAELPADVIRADLKNADHERMVTELDIKSVITVPLITGGQVTGALMLVQSESNRIYTVDDVTFVEELANRIAIAIENARLYQQAQAAIRDRDLFLSVAAHELKTPITSMLGFTQLLLRQLRNTKAPDPQRLQRALENIETQSLKLTRLIGNLLDIARIESGRLALDKETVDITKLVETVAASIRLTAANRTIIVQTPSIEAATEGNNSIIVNGDALRLEQVITNLVDNAIKYSPETQPVEITINNTPDQNVKIVVTDHGVGIPLEGRQHIFDRFYQAHEEGKFGGMGLGLFISRQIVELHGGELSAEFPDEGGTKFIVTLPC